MATIIRIKRSTGTTVPSSLASGELAYSAGTGVYNNGGDRLYYGKGDDGSGNATSRVVIGGEYFANLLDHQPGTLTASSAIITDASSKIDNLLVDDTQINGSTISITASNTALTLSPNGTAAVNVPAGYKDRSGFGTNSLVTKEYVDGQVTAQDLDFQADAGGALSIDLNTETLTIAGGTGLSTSGASNTVTINLDSSGVTAGTYGSQTAIPVFTVNAQGQLDSAGTVPLATTLNLAGDGASTGDVALLDSSLEIAGGANITTTASNNKVTVALDTAVSGLTELTVDNIKIDGSTIQTTAGNNTMYINPYPLGDSGDVIILGNLTVEGTTTTVNSVTVSLNDKNLVLADSAANAAEADGAGLTVNGANATITYDATSDRWDFNKNIEVSNVYANVTGNLTGDVNADSGDITTLTGDTATIGTVTITDLTADSAEIGNLTGTTAQFDTSVTAGQVNADNLRLDGNVISSTTGNITLDPADNVIRLSATPFVATRIPYISDANGTLATASNFTWLNATSTLTVTGRISTDNATIDSAEIGTLTGTTAQFDSDVTVAGLVDTTSLVADSASVLGDLKVTGNFVTATTDNLTEGSSNLYYTTSRVDSDMGDILLVGEGIDITDGAGTYTISAEDATYTNKGIASFDSDQFTLTAGYATISIIDGGTY